MDNGAKRGRRRVRMIDVAEQAGVSRTTASFVLNDRAAGIPEATRQRVLSIARQMGYEPNAAARSLVTGRTQRIGIVLAVPEYFLTPDLYFAHILSGVTAGNLRRDYNLLFHSQQIGRAHV